MNVKLIFALIFSAQILGLSFFLPRFLLFNIVKNNKKSLLTNPLIKRYKLLNTVNVAIGFLVLALLLFHPVFSSIELILLTIGIFFLLQVSVVIIIKQFLENSETQNYNDLESGKLSNVVHPIFIGIAIILFLSYLLKSLIDWDGSMNTQLLQMIIFVGVNAYLVFTLVTIIRKINRNTGEARVKQISFFSKAAPLFIYLSIGLSMYYFGKVLIFNFELNEFRPVMMSAALLAVGFAAFTIIKPNNQIDGKTKEE